MNTLQTFIDLGLLLNRAETFKLYFEPLLPRIAQENPWFTPDFVRMSYDNLAEQLKAQPLQELASAYSFPETYTERKRIAVISDGERPFGNFYDLLYVLLSNNDYIGKLNGKDRLLLPALKRLLCEIDPELQTRIVFSERPDKFDAIILDDIQDNVLLRNHIQKYPNLIRPRCHSIAILNGNESEEQLRALSRDIYLYFGLGCQSVRMLYVPDDYDFAPLVRILNEESQPIAMHNQFLNHLDYQKAIRLMNKLYYMDAGTFLLIESTDCHNESLATGIVRYHRYHDIQLLINELEHQKERIQHIITEDESIACQRPAGSANHRLLSDFKAKMDVLRFLEKLS